MPRYRLANWGSYRDFEGEEANVLRQMLDALTGDEIDFFDMDDPGDVSIAPAGAWTNDGHWHEGA